MNPIDELLQRADDALRAHASGEPDAPTSLTAAAAALEACMRETPPSRARLGPVLGRLRAAARIANEPDATRVDWVTVGGGRLAIGHRPRLRSLPELRRAGATHVLTLLAESEGARAIGDAATAAGLSWLWLPLPDGDPPADERLPAIWAMFATVGEALAGGGAVYMHCSAGIHGTGMIAYALLRYLGHDPAAACTSMHALRTVTATGVGEHRIAWGDAFASGAPPAPAPDPDEATEVLYRPTGPKELELVAATGYTRWPPRLPGQPIFYPVTNEAYAREIAERWNVRESGAGYVTRFRVRKRFMDRHAIHCVGASHHLEWWIPAEELEALNEHIVGRIEVVQRFGPIALAGRTDAEDYVRDYDRADPSRIRFAWNGRHGDQFEDANVAFRQRVLEVVLARGADAPIGLVEALFAAETEYAEQAWCVDLRVRELSQRLLDHGGRRAIETWLRGAYRCQDAFLTSARVRVPADRWLELARAAREWAANSATPDEQQFWRHGADEFERRAGSRPTDMGSRTQKTLAQRPEPRTQMQWQPITEQDLLRLVRSEAASFDGEARAIFERFGHAPRRLRCIRSAQVGEEAVFSIATIGSVCVFYDDVEELFSIGRLGADGLLRDWGAFGLTLASQLRNLPSQARST